MSIWSIRAIVAREVTFTHGRLRTVAEPTPRW